MVAMQKPGVDRRGIVCWRRGTDAGQAAGVQLLQDCLHVTVGLVGRYAPLHGRHCLNVEALIE